MAKRRPEIADVPALGFIMVIKGDLESERKLVHRVCRRMLQREVPPRTCRECLLQAQTGQGDGTPGCVLDAQAMIRLVRAG